MRAVAIVAGILVILVVLFDGFETILLPRRAVRKVRLRPTDMGLLGLWWWFSKGAHHIRKESNRSTLLSYFGPLMNIVGIASWATAIVIGFAFLHWGLGSHIIQANHRRTFGDDLYMSGTTFFTLGLGDVVPAIGTERALSVLEAGIGLGILAVVISYLPVLYQTFSRREIFVNRLESVAGSPPTAGAILKRYERYDPDRFNELLDVWQNWTAELMESIQSYPVIAFYRSQHDDQSWLSVLSSMLDTCTLISADPGRSFDECRESASLAYSLAVHAAGDIFEALDRHVPRRLEERMEGTHADHLHAWLHQRGAPAEEADAKASVIDALRAHYELSIATLSEHLMLPVPAFCPLCTPSYCPGPPRCRMPDPAVCPLCGSGEHEH